ncbi:hypothetical protein L2E82_42755 [Cichorium intybus]|uniref:Uncharacterized protein n=1 Tax=Cichorium intybus TaxID=13427 RepID=A0ACB8ZMC3_CICIN|nr:hypothetical protein L2E82_42755 [Cichorium intybus]
MMNPPPWNFYVGFGKVKTTRDVGLRGDDEIFGCNRRRDQGRREHLCQRVSRNGHLCILMTFGISLTIFLGEKRRR